MSEDKQIVSVSPAEMIKEAIAGRADLTNIEKLLELQERWDATQAKKAYHKAMAEFKANAPKIDKDKNVAYKEVKYSHASLANVCEKVNSELSKHGLSAAWTTKQNGQIEVTCKITHVQGHSEETTLKAGADITGSKNSIQAIGSTISYLQRYTLLCITGLATGIQDDDGKASESTEVITLEQIVIINKLVSKHKANISKLLKVFGVTTLEEVQQRDYARIIKTLEDYNASKEVQNGNK